MAAPIRFRPLPLVFDSLLLARVVMRHVCFLFSAAYHLRHIHPEHGLASSFGLEMYICKHNSCERMQRHSTGKRENYAGTRP